MQSERWYHYAGCRRWLTVQRNTSTNVVHGVDSV
jgi:sarcosine oxidase delta subunit